MVEPPWNTFMKPRLIIFNGFDGIHDDGFGIHPNVLTDITSYETANDLDYDFIHRHRKNSVPSIPSKIGCLKKNVAYVNFINR